MPAYTSPDNIQYPVSGDQVAPLETVFANLAQSTQNALTVVADQVSDQLQIHTYRWADAAARTAQTGMVAGDMGYQEDTAERYVYNGSGWVVNTGGLVLLRTTAFSAVASQSMPTVFSSGFRNYRAVIDITGTSTPNVMTTRLRSGGTDATSGYGFQILQGSGATTTALQSGATTLWNASGLGARHSCTIEFYSPAVASTTQLKSEWVSSTSTTSQAIGVNGGYHSTATVYDGFTLSASAGTITGSVHVYGYAQ